MAGPGVVGNRRGNVPASDGKPAVVTIASRRYLANARVTAASFAACNPGVPVYTLLADTPDTADTPGAPPREEPFRTVPLADLALPGLPDFAFRYTEMEFSYALTAAAVAHVLRLGHSRVLFLKQETLVTGDLAPVFDLLARHSAVLTPHFLAPPQQGAARWQEVNVLRAGTFNGGVAGFSDTPETRAFLDWWAASCRADCRQQVQRGYHYEQRWLDFAPSFLPNLGILRDPGVNVGHWNLPDRALRRDGEALTANGRPLRVIRFSGYDPNEPQSVTRYNRQFLVGETNETAQALFARYDAMLRAAGWDAAQRQRYGFGAYADGAPVTDAQRALYRDMPGAAQRFGDPFRVGPGSFRAFLESGPRRRPA
jgi:hypothetical protein